MSSTSTRGIPGRAPPAGKASSTWSRRCHWGGRGSCSVWNVPGWPVTRRTGIVEDQRLGQRADLEQPVPVGVVPRQPGDLEADDDAGLAHADVGDEPLEAFPALGAGAGAAQVIVDDDDLVGGTAERHGPAAQRVLAVGGGGVLSTWRSVLCRT